ncbi:DEAD/DEAH box helicase [Candidatus Woesearchaeota archaeon]|nr:DEAD/DEAH box helicase [Candidatus Woesearchaeota archaeon]
MQYKNFILDQFQIDAINAVEKNHTVIVSAATGTGKTLIADYVIDKFMNLKRRVVYTSPIKALTNQKYKDFKRSYGADKVGILTGDVTINRDAQILVMTTEIYRNMVISRDPLLEHLSYAIFDEIHFISDIERGYVWEESIIFSPKSVKFLCLSATIPNAHEFANWIKSTKNHEVSVVEHKQRAVPLHHLVFDINFGMSNIHKLMEVKTYPEYERKKERPNFERQKVAYLDLIRDIRDKLPCIFFVFSRADCEKKAKESARQFDFLTNEEKSKVASFLSKSIPPEISSISSVQALRHTLGRGIAFHHAGCLPKAKELVEELFEQGLIKVLYATETFAVGINMPAKTVCFNSLEKYDGITTRYLNSKEYFQLAGRAGRRGIDTVGYAVALLDHRFADLKKIKEFTSEDTQPITSQFKLSINTVLNMVNMHSPEEIKEILKLNFDYYLRKLKQPHANVVASFNNIVKRLEKLGYAKQNHITEKGKFLMNIYFQELLIGELFATDLHKRFNEVELAILLASIVYEAKRTDEFDWKDAQPIYQNLMAKLRHNEYFEKNVNKINVKRMIKFMKSWYQEGDFLGLLKICNLQEGDIIRLFRRIIDLSQQIIHGTQDYELKDRLGLIIHNIDKGLVKVEF